MPNALKLLAENDTDPGLGPAAGSTISVPPDTADDVPGVVIVVPPTTVVVPLPTLTGVPIGPGPTVCAQTSFTAGNSDPVATTGYSQCSAERRGNNEPDTNQRFKATLQKLR